MMLQAMDSRLPTRSSIKVVEGERCCLLKEGRCLVYESRPLICRSHGLPLVSNDLTEGEVDCCPLNIPALTGLTELETNLVLNLDWLTESLMRLNLAFFTALGKPELAASRFTLASLLRGNCLPPELRMTMPP